MRVIYTSKGMSKKFGVRVIYRKIRYFDVFTRTRHVNVRWTTLSEFSISYFFIILFNIFLRYQPSTYLAGRDSLLASANSKDKAYLLVAPPMPDRFWARCQMKTDTLALQPGGWTWGGYKGKHKYSSTHARPWPSKWVGDQCHTPATLNPGMRPSTHCTVRLGGPGGRSSWVWKNSPHGGLKPRPPKPAARRYAE